MKSYKKSSCHKLYLIGPTLYEKMLPLLNDVEKQEIIVFNGEIKDGVVEKFKSKCFPCGGCEKAFTSIFSLKRHFKSFHMLECCKLHTTPENTKTPQTSAKKFSCQACDKSYTRSCNLKIHIQKVHEGLKLPRSSAGIKNEFQITNSKKSVTPNVENETLKKPKYTRGPYRKKSMPQGKVFKQIHLEALLGALNSELGL